MTADLSTLLQILIIKYKYNNNDNNFVLKSNYFNSFYFPDWEGRREREHRKQKGFKRKALVPEIKRRVLDLYMYYYFFFIKNINVYKKNARQGQGRTRGHTFLQKQEIGHTWPPRVKL